MRLEPCQQGVHERGHLRLHRVGLREELGLHPLEALMDDVTRRAYVGGVRVLQDVVTQRSDVVHALGLSKRGRGEVHLFDLSPVIAVLAHVLLQFRHLAPGDSSLERGFVAEMITCHGDRNDQDGAHQSGRRSPGEPARGGEGGRVTRGMRGDRLRRGRVIPDRRRARLEEEVELPDELQVLVLCRLGDGALSGLELPEHALRFELAEHREILLSRGEDESDVGADVAPILVVVDDVHLRHLVERPDLEDLGRRVHDVGRQEVAAAAKGRASIAHLPPKDGQRGIAEHPRADGQRYILHGLQRELPRAPEALSEPREEAQTYRDREERPQDIGRDAPRGLREQGSVGQPLSRGGEPAPNRFRQRVERNLANDRHTSPSSQVRADRARPFTLRTPSEFPHGFSRPEKLSREGTMPRRSQPSSANTRSCVSIVSLPCAWCWPWEASVRGRSPGCASRPTSLTSSPPGRTRPWRSSAANSPTRTSTAPSR